MTEDTFSGTVEGPRIAYLGGRNVIYDLTGADPRFKRSDDKGDELVLFEPGQVHTFQIPVFLGSILVEQYNPDTNSWVKVEKDETRRSGWCEVEKDSEAMAVAYRIDTSPDKSFNSTLVKQLQFMMIKTGSTEKIQIRISYQRFYMDLYEYNGFDGVGPSYTPALGKYILDQLQALDSRLSTNISNRFASTDSANDMLEEDLTGTWPQNYIQDESHKVDTSVGVDTLMPARGSFYAHDFRVWKYSVRTGTVQMANKEYNLKNQAIFIYNEVTTIGSTSSKVTTERRVYLTEENYDDYIGMAGSFIDRARATLLRLGVDYELTNLNVAKTEKSESEYGVYDTIRMLTSFTGTILVTYHAFGGSVVFEDVQDMRQDILNTMRILYSKNLLTSDVLDKQPVIRDLINRIQVMEQYHAHFNRVEHAVYMGTPGFHWINIASLYDMAWDRELGVVDEIGTFRVESKVRHWCYEFILSVDLKKKLVNALRCKTLATNDVAIADLSNYIAYFNNHDDVAVRVCWCGDGTKSGLMLQLGWNFDHYPADINGVDTDTIIVTNKSGMTSKWKLIYNPLDNSYEGDNTTKVFNHTHFSPTADTVYAEDKKYYDFESVYTYFRTASERVQHGVEYYTLLKNALTEQTEYKKVDLVEGHLISNYIAGKETPICKNGVYERALYKKVPRELKPASGSEPGDYIPGTEIEDPENIFEIDDNSYSEDSKFEMPCVSMRWVEGAVHCYQLRHVLEPSDGLIAWAGSVNLAKYNAASILVRCSINKYTQPILDIHTIKGMTVKLYDRKLDKIVNRSADIGFAEPEYSEAYGSAGAGLIYYKRYGNGTADSPYHFRRMSVPTGSTLGENMFTLRTPGMIIGQIIFDLLDLCGSQIEISKKEANGNIYINFFNFVGTDSVLNQRFDLRQIEFHF